MGGLKTCIPKQQTQPAALPQALLPRPCRHPRWLDAVVALAGQCSIVHPELVTALELLAAWSREPALCLALQHDGALRARLMHLVLRVLAK